VKARVPLALPMLLRGVATLGSPKRVNTHVVKLANTPGIEDGSGVLVKTTTGYVHSSGQTMSEGARAMLSDMRPCQCLAMKTSEPFDMDNGNVRFTDFKLTELVRSERECRKVSSGTRIPGNWPEAAQGDELRVTARGRLRSAGVTYLRP